MALKKEVKRIYWNLPVVDTLKNLIAKYFLWIDEEGEGEGDGDWK